MNARARYYCRCRGSFSEHHFGKSNEDVRGTKKAGMSRNASQYKCVFILDLSTKQSSTCLVNLGWNNLLIAANVGIECGVRHLQGPKNVRFAILIKADPSDGFDDLPKQYKSDVVVNAVGARGVS